MRTIYLLIYSSLWLTSALTYCPERCSCRWETNLSLTINCSGTGQEWIPYGIDENVKILDLSSNAITEYGDVRLFKFLTELNLSHNKINQVLLLSSYSALESLDLSDNHVGDLSNLHIDNLANLKRLNLSRNVKLNTFRGLKSSGLQVLDLSHNFIKYFEEGSCDGIPNVKKIDLSYNTFKKIAGLRCESLEELDASNGNLNYLTEDHLSYFPNLKKLNVSFNKHLDFYFENESLCFDLTKIDLSNVELKKLRMSSFCGLEVANVSNNHIEEINETTFRNSTELMTLDLSNNNIHSIQKKSFINTEKLRVLDLSNNQIQDVKFTMYLKNLEYLNLASNHVKGFHNMILPNAVTLDVSYNKIYEIVVDFNNNIPKLEKLILSHNLIEILTKIKSRTIKYLDLSYCQILSVGIYAFSDIRDLTELNLIGNKLVNLDYKIFYFNANLKSVMLSHNPWSCECENEKFKNLYTYLMVNRSLSNGKELHCIQHYNESWLQVCAEVWHRENLTLSSRPTFYIFFVSFVIILLVIIAAVFGCRYLRKKTRDEDSNPGERTYRRDARTTRIPAGHDVVRRSHSANDVPREISQVQNSARPSTPPPNYEAALLLPKLSNEQLNVVMSSISNLAEAGNLSSVEEEEEARPPVPHRPQKRHQRT